MISWSQSGIKIHSSYLPIVLGIPTSEFLYLSAHHRAGTRVFFPGLLLTLFHHYVTHTSTEMISSQCPEIQIYFVFVCFVLLFADHNTEKLDIEKKS